MMPFILTTLLTAIIIFQVTFLIWLAFMMWGLGREWYKNRDPLSYILLILFAALGAERLWWVETFTVFAPSYPVTLSRLINLTVFVLILIVINSAALLVTRRLYLDK